MDDDDRPRRHSSGHELGLASQLASESLERYSLDELDERISLLQTEIQRIEAHRTASARHMLAAQALFSSGPSGSSS
ncbi:DUF1192 domain-containing protein [Novosphingobium sp. YJ-S2-02]|uniref:DUF1192 domain-containing protein n=1 Tax=Novosphingobium aureum TaxID=2792964 RepID=A0A931MJJ4_9SPHN|nr:DUF1192 domain-containing protein [Novosphingobium aureum]MBH0111489.1 DUF1192 domain-containing protein [Novosphingobium aureum]